MKKRILIGLILGLSALFVGCSNQGDSVNNSQVNTRFIDTGDYYKIKGRTFNIVKDTNTDNLYLYHSSSYRLSITPLYDKEGKIEKYNKK